ncbi:MAG: hypothetical protein ACE5G1_03480 [bacterium]
MIKLLAVLILLCPVFALFIGCATTVPPEAITLSQTLGQDLVEIQASYQALIRNQYTKMRQDAELFIREKYIPFVLKRVIERQKVLDKLNAKVSGGDYEDALNYITAFSNSAIKQINKFRGELVAPIDEQERNLLADVDAAFQNMRNANATITGHLTSIRKVQLEQDKLLEQVHLKGLRDKVMAKTINLSNDLSLALEKVNMTEKGAAEVIDDIKDLIKKTKQ